MWSSSLALFGGQAADDRLPALYGSIFETRQPPEHGDQRLAALAADKPLDFFLLLRLHAPRPRDERVAGRGQRQRVRAAVGGAAQALGETATLKLVHHGDEVRPQDAERAGDFRLLAPGIGADRHQRRILRRRKVEARRSAG